MKQNYKSILSQTNKQRELTLDQNARESAVHDEHIGIKDKSKVVHRIAGIVANAIV